MIELDIVTPVKKLVEGATAQWVKIPGYKGELEILPGHTELLTLLTTGILAFNDGTRDRLFAISHGFAEVKRNRILVLAETAEESKEVDIERAKAAQKKAEQVLGSVLEEGQFKKYQAKLQRAIIRQTIAGH